MKNYRISIKTEDIKKLKQDFLQFEGSKLITIGNTSKVAAFDAIMNDDDVSYLKLRYTFILFYAQNGDIN